MKSKVHVKGILVTSAIGGLYCLMPLLLDDEKDMFHLFYSEQVDYEMVVGF